MKRSLRVAFGRWLRKPHLDLNTTGSLVAGLRRLSIRVCSVLRAG